MSFPIFKILKKYRGLSDAPSFSSRGLWSLPAFDVGPVFELLKTRVRGLGVVF
jgi:hypothetical protein